MKALLRYLFAFYFKRRKKSNIWQMTGRKINSFPIKYFEYRHNTCDSNYL